MRRLSRSLNRMLYDGNGLGSILAIPLYEKPCDEVFCAKSLLGSVGSDGLCMLNLIGNDNGYTTPNHFLPGDQTAKIRFEGRRPPVLREILSRITRRPLTSRLLKK